MKYILLITLMMLMILIQVDGSVAIADIDTLESVPLLDIGFSFPEFSTSTKILEPVKLKGSGYAIGNVYLDDSKIYLGGSVGFILPKDNRGGVLKIGFASLPKYTAKLSFIFFHHKVYPSYLDLNLNNIEVQIPSGQIYVFLVIEGVAKLEADEVMFTEDIELSEHNGCECQQVKLVSEAMNDAVLYLSPLNLRR